MDVFGPDAGLREQEAVGCEEVDVVAGAEVAGELFAVAGVDGVQREGGVGEKRDDLVADLEAFAADARADDGSQVGGVGAVFPGHSVDGDLDDLLYRAFPARMDGRDGVVWLIIQEDGYAVRCADANGQSGDVCEQGVVALEVLAGEAGACDDGHLGAVDLVGLRDLTGELVSPAGREGSHFVSYVVFNHFLAGVGSKDSST